MALQKQTIRMSIVDGLDTKTDEKNVLPTKFLVADNVVYTKTGSASKRPGYDKQTKKVIGEADISNANAVTTFKDELLAYSANKLYTYSEDLNKWKSQGTVPFALAKSISIENTNYRLLKPQMALIGNLACYVCEELVPATQVRWIIVDNTTGATLSYGIISGAQEPKVVAVNGLFFVFTVESLHVKYRTINSGSPTSISSAINAANITGTIYDVASFGQRAYFVVPKAGTGLFAGFIDVDSVLNGPISVTDTLNFNRVSISEESSGLVRLVYGNTGGTAVRTVLYNPNLTAQLHAPTTKVFGLSYTNFGVCKDASNALQSKVFVSHPSASGASSYIDWYTITAAGTNSAETTLLNGALLQSKPQAYSGKLYFAISHDSALGFDSGDTLYMISEDAEFITKYDPDSCPRVTTGMLTPLLLSDTSLLFSASVLAEYQPPGSTVVVATTVKKMVADFSAINNYFDSELGENLHVAGGILKMYDGNHVVEHGFLEVPNSNFYAGETGVGAVLPDGTYQYLTVFAWKDKSGQLHRSAPSIPISYTVTGGPKRPTIRVFTCFFTQKQNVELEVYRTEANGTTFYKHKAGVSDIILNDKSVEYQSFTDTLDDATLIQNEVLYTTGGVLENIAADSCKYITNYKNRLFTMSSDGKYLQYSKIREQNGPVEFNDALKIKLDSRGGVGTALAVMDDHLIIFKESAIFTISGEGPNNLGEQDDFRLPFLTTSDAGCVDLNSIAITPLGITFKSAKGIYLLGRDFQVSYLGAPVEAYNDLTITSATLLPKTNQVRFTTNSTKALVYDYFHRRWSTFSNINAIDATVYKDKYVYARSNADIMTEADHFHDAGSFIPMTLASSWIAFGGTSSSGEAVNAIQGFERFYKMLLLGSYKSSCKFKVSIGFDYDEAYTSEVIIDAASILATPFYGDDFYGNSTPYGGNDPLFQWRIFPKRQKCEAFRFKIEDINSGTPGESFSLSNFAAEIGIKPPLYKRGNAHSAGTK